MKNILKYLLLCCSALSLFGCEDYLDKTPQGDKTEEDVFTRFNETEQLINRLYFLRARRRPAAGAYPLFQRLGARRRVRRFVGRERLVEQVQRRRLGTRCGTLLEMQRHDRRRSLPHFLACTLSRHPLCKRHSRRYREIQHARLAGTPRNAVAAYRRGLFPARLPALLRVEELRRMPLRGLHGRPQQPAEIRARERPLDRRKDMQRLRQRLFACSEALSGRAVRPCGEGYLPGIESHGALDRRHAALQRLDAQRR